MTKANLEKKFELKVRIIEALNKQFFKSLHEISEIKTLLGQTIHENIELRKESNEKRHSI